MRARRPFTPLEGDLLYPSIGGGRLLDEGRAKPTSWPVVGCQVPIELGVKEAFGELGGLGSEPSSTS